MWLEVTQGFEVAHLHSLRCRLRPIIHLHNTRGEVLRVPGVPVDLADGDALAGICSQPHA